MKTFIILSIVAVTLASKECGENQHYKSCGTACPLTCDNYSNPPRFCIMMCKSGCFCDEGFIKTKDGRCVKPEECPAIESHASDICSLPAETGSCYAHMPRYYFDSEKEQCERFIYGGCGGNMNNFETKEECASKCDASDICSLPAETGLCDAYFLRYYFDAEKEQCERFIYGGCGGNMNNFQTLADCESTCGA